jgi:DHA2 family methylenomycin A resistance protein-like MFS transporter
MVFRSVVAGSVSRHRLIAAAKPARVWAAVLLGVAVISVDISIVNVAIPTLGADLQVGFATLQWVLDAYIVAFAALLLATAALARAHGPMILLRIGIVGFALASLACGAAPDVTVLIIARAAQGAAASLIMPCALALTVRADSGRSTASSLAVFSAVSGAATAFGPSMGVLLLEHSGWRSIFLINLPVAVIALLLLGAVNRQDKPEGRSVALLGIVPSAVALVAVTYGLIEAGRHGGWSWGPGVVIAVGLGVVVVAGLAQRRWAALTPPGVGELRSRRVFAGCLATLIVFSVIMGTTFLAPLIMVGLYGYSLLHMAALLSLTSLALVLAAPIAGAALKRCSPRVVASAGSAVTVLGLLGFGELGTDPAPMPIMVVSAVFGAGIGLTLPALTMCVVGVADQESTFDRVALFTTFRQVGLALGIAVFGTLAQDRIHARTVQAGLHGVSADALTARPSAASGSGLSCASAESAACTVVRAVWSGYADTFRAAALVAALAALAVLFARTTTKPVVRRARSRRSIMSEETVELARAGYEAFRTQNAAGVLHLFDEDIEWVAYSGNAQLPGGGLFRGLATVATDVFGRMRHTWQHFEFVPHEFLDAGDRVIVSGRMLALARGCDAQVDVPFLHVWTIRNGKARRVELFTDTLTVHQALTAAPTVGSRADLSRTS